MSSIIVKRGAGNKEGSPIVEPLAATILALKARGKREIDDQGADKLEVTASVPYIPDLEIGDLISITDYEDSLTYTGRVTRLDHAFGLPESTTNVIIEALA